MPTAVASADDQSQQNTASQRKWFATNVSHSKCFESEVGPAKRIMELEEFSPRTEDFKDAYGTLYKVEVIVPIQDGRTEQVWAYYRDQSLCEKEQVHAAAILAEKYK